MPVIGRFFEIVILMYAKDHGILHIHAKYQNYEAAFSVETSNMIVGEMPTKQRKLVEAWIELHREDIIKNHELMMQGKKVNVIEGF
uniref:DUF4160 domain-containing protein n=1 Tax=Myoviridae sp. ct8ME27 TaxID=2826622 RepID=A0A8S5N854_9CAUD|nr:MAG TPA: protein of unknown function (DUF4160) [Myoviridae sp. ct8ME27]